MSDLGTNETIHIRESEEGPFFVLWPANSVSEQAYCGNYYPVVIESVNGAVRASVPARPEWSVEANGRDEAKERLATLIKKSLRREETLIAQYIEPDPRRPGEDNVRIKDDGPAVWAMIGYLEGVRGDSQQAAEDYDLPREAVEAAKAYYIRHRDVIDTRRAANRVPATHG